MYGNNLSNKYINRSRMHSSGGDFNEKYVSNKFINRSRMHSIDNDTN